ncbi:hypothetical protein AYJ00_14280 [Shewanella algae]|nr:hypothetical protein AYJ00_14280 [Shewanella algae]
MSAELSNVSSYSALTELHQLPFGAAAGVVANRRSRDRDVEARRSSKVNVAKQQAYEREPRKASWPLCMDAFGES